MRIVTFSYVQPSPECRDPEQWLSRIPYVTGVLECMASYATVIGMYHICYKGVLHRKKVEYQFTGLSKLQLILPFRLSLYVSRLRPDAVIIHGLISPWQILMLRWVVGPHLIIVAQHHAERPLRDFRQYLQRWADRYIGKYLFASLEQGNEWVRSKQIMGLDKVVEVMEASSIFTPMNKLDARRRTGIRGGHIYLWVGNLDHNKDPMLMASAFLTFASRHKAAELYMVYASGELEESLRLLLLSQSAGEQIHLVGKVEHSEMQWWFSSADFIVSTSHYEGSGIAVCEGISCGCIPVLTNIPSFRMMTGNGELGLLFEPGDKEKLVAALENSLDIDIVPESEKAIARFRRLLSFEKIAGKIMHVLNELTSN